MLTFHFEIIIFRESPKTTNILKRKVPLERAW